MNSPVDESIIRKKCQYCKLSFECISDYPGETCPRCIQVIGLGIEIRVKHADFERGKGIGAMGAIQSQVQSSGFLRK